MGYIGSAIINLWNLPSIVNLREIKTYNLGLPALGKKNKQSGVNICKRV